MSVACRKNTSSKIFDIVIKEGLGSVSVSIGMTPTKGYNLRKVQITNP